ncbi:hypothetical protein AB8Z38_16235 [Bradyrhizobium sp. LLZ17]|uniref:Novel STAND NTPase 3 domain-containing protein n=1 Tax=Bradyrhizobium sp. LLZ17 TaxID=3239388 RepID=A0AB39XTD8_9BRAD
MKGQDPLLSQSTSSPTSGATAALAGYEYQLNVSVLAALRLLLITKSATRITLEPANEEDLEADCEPDEPGRVVPSAIVASGYKLVVQVKFRGGEPWSIDDLDKLLNHGERRRPAKHHLDDLDTRFLLVTNADAKGAARNLLVSEFEEQSDPLEFPPSLRKTLPLAPEGRIAIRGGATERLIELEIGYILSELLRVPHSRQTECREQLCQEARRRMRGIGPGVWTRDDLLATIRAHGGYLASAAELVGFVKPSNFDDMASLLRQRNAIVITGPSGTGKTLAAIALCDMARQQDGRLDIVAVNPNDEPSITRRLTDTGPTLFYVEDPWGQYSLRRGSEAWTEQLPRLLKDARPGHQYVITSRSDMLGQARANDAFKRWSIELNAEQYSSGELAHIYDKRMDLLATDLQPKALKFRQEVLEALETPLELELFFTSLADGPQPDEADRSFLQRLLGLAHRDAVEGVVVKYLGATDQIGLSAAIWGLLAARGQIDRTQLTALQRQLRKSAPGLADGLEKTIDRLVATRHLRQPLRTVSFAHPSVRAGFETFLTENWSRSEVALESLLAALTGLTGANRAWGLETAARALNAATNLWATIEGMDGTCQASDESRSAIDAWLEESLIDPDADFQALLQLAADVGTSASTPAELARWFIKGVRRGGAFFIDDWEPPSFDDAWYQRVSADPRSAIIADRFIREQLPQDHGSYGRDLADKLDRIATGLTPAFLAVAHKLIGTGFDRNVDAVAEGAVRDLAGYEAVLIEALDDLAAIRRSRQEDTGKEWRAVEDGEYDKGYEEYYATQDDDRDYASGVLVDTFIETMRNADRWQDLANHARLTDFAGRWAQEVSSSKAAVTADEIRAILEATRKSGDEEAGWNAARQCWDATLEPLLADRILSQPDDESLRRSLVQCAITAAPSALINCLQAHATSPSVFIHLLVDMYAVQAFAEAERLESLSATLSPEATELLEAFETIKQGPRAVGAAALALLEAAAPAAASTVLGVIVPVMIASGSKPAGVVRRWLAEATDRADAAAATQAAITIGEEPLVWLALHHDRADARQSALEYLASRLPDPLPTELLALANDKGNRVRRSLTAVLSSRPHSEHFPVLMQLALDRWSDAEPHYQEPDSYPIAREAVAALETYGSLGDEIGTKLIALARETSDEQLRRDALSAAARLCGPAVRRQIWSLFTDNSLGWLRVDAIDALSTASTVELEIVRKISADRLMKLSAPLAASATILVGAHLPVADAVQIFERVGHSQSHRALLLLGVVALGSRDRAAALGLLKLLDAGHPARRLLATDELLPPNVLDDLGDVRIRRYVGRWLNDRIAKK